MSEIICGICFHHCHLPEGKAGFCRTRVNHAGRNESLSYAKLTGLAMDPIEKKPLRRFCPGSYIMSVGSFGCNLACPFCQNYEISQRVDSDVITLSPKELAEIVVTRKDNLGLSFTYNEPLINYEYIIDTARLIKKAGKRVVIVTNGTACLSVLEKLMPYVDAMNVDLKGDGEFYKELGGDYQTVKETIAYVYDKCHLEVTTLVIPQKNDRTEWIEEEAKWLSCLSKDIVLHLSRYFPRYKYKLPPTPVETILTMRKAALKYLPYVYTGNI